MIPPPPPRPITTWIEAEHNAAAWMRHWGYTDAAVSGGGPDGGVDVVAAHALGQVKFQAAQVGRPDLQRLVGARAHDHHRHLFFFTGTGYSSAAVEYADHIGMALYVYRLDGAMLAANQVAQGVVASRRPSQPRPRRFWPFVLRNWRWIAGAWLILLPFSTFGEGGPYDGPIALDILKGVGIFVGCWISGIALVGWHVIRRDNGRRDAGSLRRI